MEKASRQLEAVGHRELRENLSPLLKRITESGASVAVTNRNRVEAVLVSASAYESASEVQQRLERLQGMVPLLMAAASAGAALPSSTLDALGIKIPFDWRRLNAFQAAYPVEITHNEEGHALPDLPRVEHTPIREDDEL